MLCSIDDSGTGIPSEYRQQIFDPFVRLEESRSRYLGGVGLGLSIAQKVIHSHQGEVLIEDSPLGGARFIVKLPLVSGILNWLT